MLFFTVIPNLLGSLVIIFILIFASIQLDVAEEKNYSMLP
tara:strand:+ start:584 stop:703 length:120 start_codon:yes stop_codon:yes gene_type:complete